MPNFLLKAAKEADKTLIIDGSDGIFKSKMLYFAGDEINIILEDCVADCNSDDGFDTCNALGNIVFKRCAARYNGFSEEMVLSGKADNILTNSKCQRANNKEKGALDLRCDGGGFGSPFWGTTFAPKVLSGQALIKPQDFLEPVSFYECCAINNYGDGFTRRSAPNPVYIENSYSVGNGLDNYRLACSIASTEKFMTYGIKVESIVKNSFQRRSTFGNDINKGSGIAKVDESKISIKNTNKTSKEIMKELQISFSFKSSVNEYIEAKR